MENLLTDEHTAGHLRLAVAARTLAYGIVRLMEAYLYADVVAGEQQDIDSAMRLVALLLSEQPTGA